MIKQSEPKSKKNWWDIKKIQLQILISKILKSCTIPLMGERYLQNSPLQEYLEKKTL